MNLSTSSRAGSPRKFPPNKVNGTETQEYNLPIQLQFIICSDHSSAAVVTYPKDLRMNTSPTHTMTTRINNVKGIIQEQLLWS